MAKPQGTAGNFISRRRITDFVTDLLIIAFGIVLNGSLGKKQWKLQVF
jgi:hypothetical protein